MAHGKGEEIFVGLMSGTSADGIDAVAVKLLGVVPVRASVLAHTRHPFPAEVRKAILTLATAGTVAEVCELNFALGARFGRAALSVIRKAGLTPDQIKAIGSHGQTVRHLPNARTRSTLQIGEPAVIAELTGVTTVADFRVADMAAGGQGAPLVPYADWALFADGQRARIIQNIGGIANLTFLPRASGVEKVIAFDTGPGNMVIDAVVERLSDGKLRLDRNGAWAAQGRVSERLLAHALSHPFFQKRPPRTTGREEFGQEYTDGFLKKARALRLRPEDIVVTATALTAESIVRAYRRLIFPLLGRKGTHAHTIQVVLGGGGAKNRTLRKLLQQQLEECELLTHKDFGIDDTAKEALAFAILARETLHGRPGNIPGATGARHAAVLGKIVPRHSSLKQVHVRAVYGKV